MGVYETMHLLKSLDRIASALEKLAGLDQDPEPSKDRTSGPGASADCTKPD